MRNAQVNHSTACLTPKNTIFILNIYTVFPLQLYKWSKQFPAFLTESRFAH